MITETVSPTLLSGRASNTAPTILPLGRCQPAGITTNGQSAHKGGPLFWHFRFSVFPTKSVAFSMITCEVGRSTDRLILPDDAITSMLHWMLSSRIEGFCKCFHRCNNRHGGGSMRSPSLINVKEKM
jgi:hypothetical protein